MCDILNLPIRCSITAHCADNEWMQRITKWASHKNGGGAKGFYYSIYI